MGKRVLILLLLLGLASSALWQDGWHDAGSDLYRFRRSIIVSHLEATDVTGPAEVNLTFSGAYPYCNDGNFDFDLKDAEDSLSLRMMQKFPNGSLGEVPFQVEDWESFGCISNSLVRGTLRFDANFTNSSIDSGFGPGKTPYQLSYDTAEYPYVSANNNMAAQTETAIVASGAEERRWQEEWRDAAGTQYDYRARLITDNQFGSWRFNELVSKGIFFHRNLYCYDVNSDGNISAGDLLAMRVVREYADGFAEIPSNFSGVCSETTDGATVSFVADIPPSMGCDSSFFVYYSPSGLAVPDYPFSQANSTGVAVHKDKELAFSGSGYCGNFVCESGEDRCACPNDCCPVKQDGICDPSGICAPNDPDCCSGCWSSRYICSAGRGQDCYPGSCDAGSCDSGCTSNSDCSSGFCYNLTATNECFDAPAPAGSVLSITDGKACDSSYDYASSACAQTCLVVSDKKYLEYTGSPLEISFTLNNTCAYAVSPAVGAAGPLSSYVSLSSSQAGWDGSSLTIGAGSAAVVVATLAELPSDLAGIRELKLYAEFTDGIAGSSPIVVVYPNFAYVFGREVPMLPRAGRVTYMASFNSTPVRVVITTW